MGTFIKILFKENRPRYFTAKKSKDVSLAMFGFQNKLILESNSKVCICPIQTKLWDTYSQSLKEITIPKLTKEALFYPISNRNRKIEEFAALQLKS